jgi:hypothetical protein
VLLQDEPLATFPFTSLWGIIKTGLRVLVVESMHLISEKAFTLASQGRKE